MPRGGKRPGAGAPKGNLNALKHGRYSKQFAVIGKLLASEPKTRDALLVIAARTEDRQARTNTVTALLLTKMVENIRQQAGSNRRTGSGLNLGAPSYVWDSIRAAAAQFSDGEYESLVAELNGSKKTPHSGPAQSNTDTPAGETINPQIQNDVD